VTSPIFGAGKQLAVAGSSLFDRTPIGHLVAAARKIASIDRVDELTAAVPELARTVCPVTSAALVLFVANGDPQVVSSSGRSFRMQGDLLLAAARAALERWGPSRQGGSGSDAARARGLAVLPLASGPQEPVLVLERRGVGECLSEAEIEHLAVYASVAGTALARARTAAALREALAREAAMLGVVRDGVIALDQAGTVRTLNEGAAAALGATRDELLGRVLREVPGLAPLASALAGTSDLVPDAIPVRRRRVRVRSQVHEGGIVATVRDGTAEEAAEEPAERRTAGTAARYTFDQFLGNDPAFVQVLENAKRAVELDLPILITGESGTGKELLAQAIHNASSRAAAPFVGINVTAIPGELLESELFGYEGGAFTGARTSGHAGKFEAVGRGTLLLDEIGDMPLEMQAKLLRVLQERVVQRLGGTRGIAVRAHVIATTHRDLEQAVKLGRFRLDLFHRLRGVQLHLPALREREGDVRLLVEHHLKRHADRAHQSPVKVEPAVLAAMEAYDWPGNVRELLNVLDSELALLPAGEEVLSRLPTPLSRRGAAGGGSSSPAPGRSTGSAVVRLSEIVRSACRDALAEHGGNLSAAARALGICKGTLRSKLSGSDVAPLEVSASAPAPRPRSLDEGR
jgi:transcriptional regulator with PAS, ATPase and Fis domain